MTEDTELLAYLRQNHPGIVEAAEEDLDNYGELGRVNADLEPVLDEWDQLRERIPRDTGQGEIDSEALLAGVRIYRLLKNLHARHPIDGDLRVQLVINQLNARGLPAELNPEGS